jgi:hypothetical protein
MFHRCHIPSALWLACCSLVEVAQAQTTQDVTVTFEPSIPLIEHRDGRQLFNFDLVVANSGSHRLHLAEIEISVFDATGKLAMRKSVNSNGLRQASRLWQTSSWIRAKSQTSSIRTLTKIPANTELPTGRLKVLLEF